MVASFMAATLSSYRLVNELGVWLRLRSQAKTQPPPSRMDLEDFGISPPADGATSADGGSVALMVRMERDQAIKREDRKWQNARELLALL